MRILILNGPNLNLLGQRENDVYGNQSLGDLEIQMRKFGQAQGVDVECYQSNHEGHLIDALHRARNRVQGVVFNPGGYCHTSVALRDAIAAIKIPVIEVHISNIHAREEFRAKSLTAGVCAGQICGMGFLGYELGVLAVMRLLKAPVQAQPAAAEPQRKVERFSDTREGREFREEAPREERREERKEPVREERKDEKREERKEDRHAEEEREGKRRRRGRRGGRGRRRDQEEGGREEREGVESGEQQETIDITERYANLKGVVVRRGLDVLAELDEEGEEEETTPPTKGLVTFRDAPEETQYAAAPKTPAEPALEVTPTAPRAPEHRHTAHHRQAEPEMAPATAAPEVDPEAVTPPVEEAVAEAPVTAEEPVVAEESVAAVEDTAEPEVAEPVAEAPVAEEPAEEKPVEEAPAEAEIIEAPAADEAEAAAEGEEAPEDEAKRGRGRRRKAASSGRRRAPRKKAQE